MCPDDEMLSAYLDGELAPDSVRSVEAKLSGESEYRTRFKELTASTEFLHSCPEPDFVQAQELVWARVQLSTRRVHGIGAFSRRISVPMPLAAAAGFLLLLAGMLFSYFAIGNDSIRIPSAASSAGASAEVTVQMGEVEDLGLLLDTLNSAGNVRQITIDMPENARFAYQGEARFMRADDGALILPGDTQ